MYKHLVLIKMFSFYINNVYPKGECLILFLKSFSSCVCEIWEWVIGKNKKNTNRNEHIKDMVIRKSLKNMLYNLNIWINIRE